MNRALLVSVLLFAACDDARTVQPPVTRRDATVTSTHADAAAGLNADAAAGPNADASVGPNADAAVGALDAAAIPAGPDGVGILTRLAGLWSGPATGTRLGTFPRVVMDFRAADPKTLFGRVDLDANNSLRMAFYVENIAGQDTVIFRNGGLFMGLGRDTRTKLVEVDEARGHYRFCETEQGCDYNEAIFDFSGPTSLTLDVTVRRQPHEHWTPTRQVVNPIPAPFPTPGAVAAGFTFPPMPSLAVTVSWATPLTAPGDAWVILSTSDCSISGCTVRRHQMASAPIGATSATMTLDQIHAGEYKIIGFIDRDQNVGTTFAPDSGDGVTAPNQPLTIAPTGTTPWSGTIIFDLP